MKKDTTYDIFISYRRKGGEFLAHSLYDKLCSDHYSVFLDTESLHSGKFNAQLLQVIDQCTYVIVILSPHALDRSLKNEDDWVRKEIAYALEKSKTIIPLFLEDFELPEQLPHDISELKNYHGLKVRGDYLDAFYEKLKKILDSKTQGKKHKKPPFLICGILAVLSCLVFLFFFGIYRALTKPNFTLDIKNDTPLSRDGNQDWNCTYVFSNKGGTIVNVKITPHMIVDFNITRYTEHDTIRQGHYSQEISNYFPNHYFFDNLTDMVEIPDENGNLLRDYLRAFSAVLNENDMELTSYALKMYLDISYTDRLGLKHSSTYDMENNYNFILFDDQNETDGSSPERYLQDIDLFENSKITEAICNAPIYEGMESETAQNVAGYLFEDIENVLTYEEPIDYENGEMRLDDSTGSFITNTDNFLIGYHVLHKHCSKE